MPQIVATIRFEPDKALELVDLVKSKTTELEKALNELRQYMQTILTEEKEN